MTKKEIKNKISLMLEKDQKMRKRWADSGFDEKFYDESVDIEIQSEVNKIIKEVGWPVISEYGKETPEELWVLVQHAPNIKFREGVLFEMLKVDDGEIDKVLVAKTIDRVRIKKNEKQLYGTAFSINLEKKELEIYPIEDEVNINKRRKEMGMDSFEDQKNRAIESYEKSKK